MESPITDAERERVLPAYRYLSSQISGPAWSRLLLTVMDDLASLVAEGQLDLADDEAREEFIHSVADAAVSKPVRSVVEAFNTLYVWNIDDVDALLEDYAIRSDDGVYGAIRNGVWAAHILAARAAVSAAVEG